MGVTTGAGVGVGSGVGSGGVDVVVLESVAEVSVLLLCADVAWALLLELAAIVAPPVIELIAKPTML